MSTPLDPCWILSTRRAVERTLQAFSIRSPNMVHAIKMASMKLAKRSDGPFSISSIELDSGQDHSNIISLDDVEAPAQETTNG